MKILRGKYFLLQIEVGFSYILADIYNHSFGWWSGSALNEMKRMTEEVNENKRKTENLRHLVQAQLSIDGLSEVPPITSNL